MRTFKIPLLRLACTVVLATPASAITVTLAIDNPGWPHFVYSLADDGTGPRSEVRHDFTTLPATGSVLSSDGRTRSDVDYSFVAYGTGAAFTIDVNQVILGGTSPLGAQSDVQTSVYFRVDQNTTYSIGGSFGGTGAGMHFYLDGLLYHSAPYFGTFDFFEYGGVQTTNAAPSASFAYGNGSLWAPYSPSGLTGTLLAGEVYAFNARAIMYDNYNTGGAGSASGQIQLTIGASIPTAVPDPSSTLGLLAVATAAASVVSRWLRNRAS
jgi:hypothetical protein